MDLLLLLFVLVLLLLLLVVSFAIVIIAIIAIIRIIISSIIIIIIATRVCNARSSMATPRAPVTDRACASKATRSATNGRPCLSTTPGDSSTATGALVM